MRIVDGHILNLTIVNSPIRRTFLHTWLGWGWVIRTWISRFGRWHLLLMPHLLGFFGVVGGAGDGSSGIRLCISQSSHAGFFGGSWISQSSQPGSAYSPSSSLSSWVKNSSFLFWNLNFMFFSHDEEADLPNSYINFGLGISQKWSPENKIYPQISFHVEDHELCEYEGILNSYQ